MRTNRIALLTYIVALASACGSEPPPQPPAQAQVALSLTASAYRVQQLAALSGSGLLDGASDRATDALRAAPLDIVTGTMAATNTTTGESQSFSWSVTVQPDAVTVESNRTIVLAPGSYQFALLLASGDQQYAGLANADLVDGANTVDMVIRPVIGDTLLDARVAARLNDFRLSYDPGELGNIADPRIGLSVDGAAETIFQLGQATGATDSYVNLSTGLHQLELRLYDGGLQIGKSLDTQETVQASPGVNITMDLVALISETQFSFTKAGGDARFTFVIPAEVVEEAGGIDRLQARISLVGSTNAFQEQVLTVRPGSTPFVFLATAIFNDMQYGNVTASLTFSDVSVAPTELLGACTQPITLGGNDSNQLCNITLRRRAVIGGRLLATLGINVFDADGTPVPGAVVTAGDTLLGTTQGSFGSPGYLKAFLPAGPHTLVATAAGRAGSVTVDLAALSINNLEIQLAASPATPITMSFVDAASAAPVLTPITVRVEGAGRDFVRDSNGLPRTTFAVTGGFLALQLSGAAQPSPVNPVELILIVDGEGLVDTSSIQQITGPAPVLITTRLIDNAAPPQGVTVATDATVQTDAAGTVIVAAAPQTAPDPQTGATALVTIPAGTVVTDIDGAPLQGQLTTELAYFSPREEQALLAFPGGLDVRVQGGPTGASDVLFKSAGMVAIEIRDASGRVGRNFSGDGLEIAIEVAAGTINPFTGQVVANGDQLPLWSKESNSGTWNNEGEATAVVQPSLVGGTARTVVTFRARHLTLWNLDWPMPSCTFSRFIDVVDSSLNPVPEATAMNFSYRVTIADASGLFGGYIRTQNANAGAGGFNVLQFLNAPNVNVVRIIVYNAPNATGSIIAFRNFNAAADNKLCEGAGRLFLPLD